MTPLPKAWFKIGDAPGLRSVKDQITGLAQLAPFAPRASILDLGCAEGLVSKYYVETYGADLVHGIEAVPERVAVANELCAGFSEVKFFAGDLNDLASVDAMAELLPQYDVVLGLAILHKLNAPKQALAWMAKRARVALAIRMPTKLHYFTDQRSGGEKIEPEHLLGTGWKLIGAELGPRHERTLIFRRLA